MSATDRTNAPLHTWNDLDWRFWVGIVGHDHLPRFWDSKAQSWVRTVPESSCAAASSEGTREAAV
jgi:hypothetical protein